MRVEEKDSKVLQEEKDVIKELSPQKQEAFPIVGIGSSAGGIEALISFFSAMPATTGMAFVVIQHMSPEHKSLLPEILQQHTRLAVHQATDGIRIQPDHVYVTPPDKNLYLSQRTLKLISKPEHPYVAHSIDVFFRSMAESLKDSAIGVILSGAGSDGTFGARLIDQKLGMVVVQDPRTAQTDSMPQSAISIGVADAVLSLDKMPTYLMEYARTYFGKPARERWEKLARQHYDLQEIFTLVKKRTGRDLSINKLPTIYRQIERRMSINQINSPEDYVRFLHENPAEIDSLHKFFLINVTHFFQNPQAYHILKNHLKENILKKKTGDTVSAWTLGCATGEETYSMAILLQECQEEMKVKLETRVLATDIDQYSLNLAQTALYPSSIAAEDISPERLAKFFVKKDSYYQVKKGIRDKVRFSQRDYLSMVPFSSIDLISPRGIVAYLNREAQKKLVPLAYSVLNPGGILFLGLPDTIPEFPGLFGTLDSRWKIYERR